MAPPPKPSRHLACVLCRDRKVKCDGAKPSCEKCVKAGERCSYATPAKASRAELQQTILRLHERIEQAEANQSTLMAQQQMRNCSCQSSLSFDNPFLGSLDFLDHQHQHSVERCAIESHNVPAGSLPPFGAGSPSAGSFVTGPTPNTTFPFDPTQDITSPPFLEHQDGSTTVNSMSPFSTSVGEGGFDTPSSVADHPVRPPLGVLHDQRSRSSGLPSLRDIKVWSQTNSTSSLSSRPTDTSEDEEVEQLLQEFICLATVTESAQQSIIGVADTAAMYSSYFRRLVSMDAGAGRSQHAEELERFLGTLEARMREISEISSREVLGQSRKSREAVGSAEAYRDRMKQVEEELRRRAVARSDLFSSRYNLSKPLWKQDSS